MRRVVATVGNVALCYGIRYDDFDPNVRRTEHTYEVQFKDVTDPIATHVRVLRDGVVVPTFSSRFDVVPTPEERHALTTKLTGLLGALDRAKAAPQDDPMMDDLGRKLAGAT